MDKPRETVQSGSPGVKETADNLAELALRIAVSDRDAYAELFRRLHEPLVRYARQITKDDEIAYDVLQDVFMKLWTDRESLAVRESLKAMLYTMVRNRALNSLRRNKWRSNEAIDDRPDLHSVEPDAADMLDAEQLRQHMDRWINQLPKRRAEAFILSRFHELSHSQIADVMGLSVRTVDTHIVHALRDLRVKLDSLQQDGAMS